jgi:diketogulonate reductase-like aldo/keto reductase
MDHQSLLIDGVRVPRFLYGTAWKEQQTQCLTELALRQGFRGIDTANQRRHYDEGAVGRAVAASVESGLLNREDLFLQTKFTFQRGQDHRLPYDSQAPVGVQAEQSFVSSLEHLGVGVIDSYLLHGPTLRTGLVAADWEAWRAMEAIHDSGRARLIGVSNVSLEQLQSLCREARVPPRFVQNRCYAERDWDREIRTFCGRNGLIYQGFSLLTANRKVVARPELAQIAARHGRTVSQVIFRFVLEVGMVPLTGTTDAAHMRDDLEVFDFCRILYPQGRRPGAASPGPRRPCGYKGGGRSHFAVGRLRLGLWSLNGSTAGLSCPREGRRARRIGVRAGGLTCQAGPTELWPRESPSCL